MPGALDTTARNVARRLTDKYGTAGIIRQETRTINPNTGLVSATATTDTAVPITPPSARPPRNLRTERGPVADTIQADQLWTTIPALGVSVVPVVGDRFFFQSETEEYQVIGVYPLYSGELVANYAIQCKR